MCSLTNADKMDVRKVPDQRQGQSATLPIGVIARIMAMIGNTAALGASCELTTQAVTVARMERWRAWRTRVFVYTRPNGEIWNRFGIETLMRFLSRNGRVPAPPTMAIGDMIIN